MPSYKTLTQATRTSMMLGKLSSVPYTSRPLRFSANPMFREKKPGSPSLPSTLSKIEELPDYAVNYGHTNSSASTTNQRPSRLKTVQDSPTPKTACVDGKITSMICLKEYSSLQDNPDNVRYIHTVLIVHIYIVPWGVDNV